MALLEGARAALASAGEAEGRHSEDVGAARAWAEQARADADASAALAREAGAAGG